MKKRKEEYYNSVELRRIINLMTKNPKLSLELLNGYIDKYDKDYTAMVYRVILLISLGRLYQAKDLLKEAESLANGDKKFLRSTKKYTIFRRSLLVAKMKYLAHLEKYEDVHNLYVGNYETLKEGSTELSTLNFYSKSKMGKPVENLNLGISNYLYQQMEEYDETRFFDRITDHLADYTSLSDMPNDNVFTPDFPIAQIIDEIKKYIPSSSDAMFNEYIADTYIFKYDYCGREKGKIADYIKVICFHNTGDLITIYPTCGYENYDYIDLNYLQEQYYYKPKRKSMVERFNKKWNK